jgi:hypothetical protein
MPPELGKRSAESSLAPRVASIPEPHVSSPDLVAAGLPSYGGVNLIEAMQMIEAAGLGDKGSDTNSAETLYWLSHITRNAANRVFSGTPEEVANFMYQRLTKEHARKL